MPTIASIQDHFATVATADPALLDDIRADQQRLEQHAFATVRAPVTQEQVCAAFGLKRRDWDWAFRRVSQFLERGGLRQEERGALTYRIYHETFREFLRKRLVEELPDCHRRWAEQALEWRTLKDYGRLYALRHLVSHLIAASRR
jgi:hypothetical protein